MKDSYKTGSFAFKLMIKIEAKGTNWRENSSLWVDMKRSSNKRGDVFGWVCVICVRGKFSQLDFNQFNFCRQRLCMGDLFFEQGIGL